MVVASQSGKEQRKPALSASDLFVAAENSSLLLEFMRKSSS
jgi:hypothetical protein